MDPIADMIIRIKNAGAVNKSVISMPHSKLKMSILEVLKRRGYIKDFKTVGASPKLSIEIELAYSDAGRHRIEHIARVSKLSCRNYFGLREIKPVKYGKGSMVISTSKGVMSDDEARKAGVGGEALITVW